MADSPHAIRVSLNRRAKEVGLFDQELTMEELAAVRSFYDFTCLNPACRKKPATSIDHVIPLSEGGQNTLDNLQLLCTNCNKAKGAKTVDYREGKVVPADYVAENTSEPDRKAYTKHDWDEMEYEYVYESKSIIDLARLHKVSQSNVEAVCSRRKWVEKRIKVRGELGEQVKQDAAELLRSESMDALRETITVLRGAIVRWEEDGSKAGFKDIIEGLKLLGAMQGQTTSRQAVNVSDEPDDAALFARINRVFDTGEEGRTYTPLGPGGEETSAGYTD